MVCVDRGDPPTCSWRKGGAQLPSQQGAGEPTEPLAQGPLRVPQAREASGTQLCTVRASLCSGAGPREL